MQGLPAIKVPGTQAGSVLQQQGRCLAESTGSSNVQLQANQQALSAQPQVPP